MEFIQTAAAYQITTIPHRTLRIGSTRFMPGPPAQRPDAVFAMNDQMAIGAIRAIHDMGLTVPDDIAVVGFDGTIEPMLSPMTLTSARQDMVGLGARAVRALLDLMAGALPGDAEIAPVHLVIGESTIGRASTAVLDPSPAT